MPGTRGPLGLDPGPRAAGGDVYDSDKWATIASTELVGSVLHVKARTFEGNEFHWQVVSAATGTRPKITQVSL